MRLIGAATWVLVGILASQAQGEPNKGPEKPPASPCPAGMVRVEGGVYTMGERTGQVTVGPVCLDVTEVTVTAYRECVRGGKCSAAGQAPRCNANQRGRGDHPINCVDWKQATAYCAFAKKRLPNEEEWEWAARGGAAGNLYPWGTALPDPTLSCTARGIDRKTSCPVGGYPAGDSPQGLKDLAGNVWEWTSSNFNVAGSQDRAFLEGGTPMVVRGGSWGDDTTLGPRAGYRRYVADSARDPFTGFRCASTP